MCKFIGFVVCCALGVSAPASAEIIGPWEIEEAPISAELTAGGTSAEWSWLNIDGPIEVDESDAFSGFSIIADGYANGEIGTTVTITLSTTGWVNGPGYDIMFFEARYNPGEYAISTEWTTQGEELLLLSTDFLASGEFRDYYYDASPIPTTAEVYGAFIDFSDLGVPLGESATTLTFMTTKSLANPLGVGLLIPEPTSLLVMGLGAAAFTGTRRRRRRS